MAEEKKGTLYTMEEVNTHNTSKSLWTVIHGKVYDLTEWQAEHPGGEDVLLDKAGEDSTEEFEDSFHSEEAREQMKDYVIGYVEGQPEFESNPAPTARALPQYTEEASEKSGFPLSAVQVAFVAVAGLVMARLFLTSS